MLILRCKKWNKITEYKDDYRKIDIYNEENWDIKIEEWLNKNQIEIIKNEYGHLIWIEIDLQYFDITLNLINSQDDWDNDMDNKLTKKNFKEILDKHNETFVWEWDEESYYYCKIVISDKNNRDNNLVLNLD